MKKSLDQKLAAIHADPHGCKEFILADAKDADMGFGVTAPGPQRDACPHGTGDERAGDGVQRAAFARRCSGGNR